MKVIHGVTGQEIEAGKMVGEKTVKVGTEYYIRTGSGFPKVKLLEISGGIFVFSDGVYSYPVKDFSKTDVYSIAPVRKKAARKKKVKE